MTERLNVAAAGHVNEDGTIVRSVGIVPVVDHSGPGIYWLTLTDATMNDEDFVAFASTPYDGLVCNVSNTGDPAGVLVRLFEAMTATPTDGAFRFMAVRFNK